jgi:Protein of unknown function (DUF2442)
VKTRTEKYLNVVDARYIGGHKLRLSFNDGRENLMDFGPFLRKAQNPDLTKYRSLRKFKGFHLNYGNVMWGDYEMIFPVADLYDGKI